tara:strand:- start:144 stop:1064 length:921 start_codon:yes stop_codon:yes gene_type:complete
VKKILLLKHGSFGDIVMALPAFASIRNHFKTSKIFLLTEKKYINFFNESPYVDICIEDNRNKNFFSIIYNILKLFHKKFDLIIDLQNSKRTSFYNLLFRIFQKSKISSSRPFAHFRYIIPKQGKETVNAGLLNQIKMIGVSECINKDYSWLKIKLKEKFIKPIALFIPGVSKSGYYKQWEPHKFAKIAKYLEKLNYTICVIGNETDKKSVSPIIQSCSNVLNKIGKSPPKIIYSLALNSKIIFSNDTGPGHIASLAKNNFIWIVNDNNISKANLPFGDHVYVIKSSSVKNISSQEVIDFIKKNKLF